MLMSRRLRQEPFFSCCVFLLLSPVRLPRSCSSLSSLASLAPPHPAISFSLGNTHTYRPVEASGEICMRRCLPSDLLRRSRLPRRSALLLLLLLHLPLLLLLLHHPVLFCIAKPPVRPVRSDALEREASSSGSWRRRGGQAVGRPEKEERGSLTLERQGDDDGKKEDGQDS